MTAQIGDKFRFENGDYTLIAMDPSVCFDPQKYGLIPAAACTACWRGFWGEYKIRKDGIWLVNLFVCTLNDEYPPIEGVLPEADQLYLGHRKYENLNIRVPYTGQITAGAGFLREYYIHGGYQRMWAYETVKQFEFDCGLPVAVRDLSRRAAELRQEHSRPVRRQNGGNEG